MTKEESAEKNKSLNIRHKAPQKWVEDVISKPKLHAHEDPLRIAGGSQSMKALSPDIRDSNRALSDSALKMSRCPDPTMGKKKRRVQVKEHFASSKMLFEMLDSPTDPDHPSPKDSSDSNSIPNPNPNPNPNPSSVSNHSIVPNPLPHPLLDKIDEEFCPNPNSNSLHHPGPRPHFFAHTCDVLDTSLKIHAEKKRSRESRLKSLKRLDSEDQILNHRRAEDTSLQLADEKENKTRNVFKLDNEVFSRKKSLVEIDALKSFERGSEVDDLLSEM